MSGNDSTVLLACAVVEKRTNAGDAGETFTVQINPDGIGSTIPNARGFDDLKIHSGLSGSALAEAHLVEPTVQARQQPLHALYSESVKAGRKKELQALVSAVITGAVDVEILTEKDTPLLHIDYKHGSVPAAMCGDGIRALLRLTMELAIHPGGVVLLEEPEIHQHPALIRQSARAIMAAVKHGVQVVMTTHSIEFIDALVAEAGEDGVKKMGVLRVALTDGNLVSSHIDGPDAAFARAEIQDDLR